MVMVRVQVHVRTTFTDHEDLHVAVNPLRSDLWHAGERRADVPHLRAWQVLGKVCTLRWRVDAQRRYCGLPAITSQACRHCRHTQAGKQVIKNAGMLC